MPAKTDSSIRRLAHPIKKGGLIIWLVLLTLLVVSPRLPRPTAPVIDPVEADPMTRRFSGTPGRFVGLYDGISGLRSSSTCEFGQPDYGASCQHDNGNVGILAGISGGVFGQRNFGPYGILGHNDYGVYGADNNGNYGSLGSINIGVYGEHNTGNRGFLGTLFYGVFGQHNNGNSGFLGGSDSGVYGEHNTGNRGFLGTDLFGVFGRHFNTQNRGYLGSSAYGVYGYHQGSLNYGYIGSSDVGVYGFYYVNGPSGNFGSIGGSFYGARGWNANDNRGYLGHDSYGVWGAGSPWAGYFMGDVEVTGTLSKAGGSFKIDHPLDPAGTYLSHSFVESPDMMNVYNGNVVLDATGEALIELPAYFEALNRDFRYGLTALGAPGPNLYIAEKITGNRFKIAGGAPGMEVSWQVTGIRHDPWAEEHRIAVEEAKPAEERGSYLHPGLYGQPETRSVAWVRDPEGMRAVEEMPARLEAERRRTEQERERLDEEQQRIQHERAHLREARGRQKP